MIIFEFLRNRNIYWYIVGILIYLLIREIRYDLKMIMHLWLNKIVKYVFFTHFIVLIFFIQYAINCYGLMENENLLSFLYCSTFLINHTKLNPWMKNMLVILIIHLPLSSCSLEVKGSIWSDLNCPIAH